MIQILAAKPAIKEKIAHLKQECQDLIDQSIHPKLVVFLVGDNPSSIIYTSHKKKFCEKIKAQCEIIRLPATISADEFTKTVDQHICNPKVHGALIQLPVPKQLLHLDLTTLIPAHKDVDGFHNDNLLALIRGKLDDKKTLLPCTPKGILTLLKHYNIAIEGKNICIIGRSQIVGRPLALLLTNYNATVTLCHSRTKNLAEHTRNAEVIISAVGKLGLLTKKHIGNNKPIVIDVGTNLDETGKLRGDADYTNIAPLCSYITPVPGGVGPMTVLSVAENLLTATKLSIKPN